jgi:hypothetical protein
VFNKTLEKRLHQELAEKQRWQALGLREAEQARQRGDMVRYFGRMRCDSLADQYWYLERYEFAREYYALTAEVYINERAWEEEHMLPNYPIDVALDQETSAFVKAGMLEQGRIFLHRWHEYALQHKARASHMRHLSHFAAQIGEQMLAESIRYYVEDQMAMFDLSAEKRQRAVRLFHYNDYAMINFLLGRYERTREDVEQVFEAEKFIEGQRVTFYSKTEQKIGVEKAKGLGLILDMLEGRGELNELYLQAVTHLEQTMLYAHRTVGLLREGYHLRLCTRMAKDILEGRKPNPNPFAS